MEEQKSPKKPLIFYYVIVILAILLINMLLVPSISKQRVIEVDYGTFMQMTYADQIGMVQIQPNQILFTNKDGTQIFCTGIIQDDNLVDRLYQHGAVFASEIQQEASPILSFLLGYLLPIGLMILLGNWLAP